MQGKELTGLLIDNSKCEARGCTITDNLDSFYKTLGCETIDIVTRYINGQAFDIVIDDDGKFIKDNPPAIRCFHEGKPADVIVGKVFICHANEEGELTDITEDDMKSLMSSLSVGHMEDGKKILFLDATYYPEDVMRSC